MLKKTAGHYIKGGGYINGGGRGRKRRKERVDFCNSCHILFLQFQNQMTIFPLNKATESEACIRRRHR